MQQALTVATAIGASIGLIALVAGAVVSTALDQQNRHGSSPVTASSAEEHASAGESTSAAEA